LTELKGDDQRYSNEEFHRSAKEKIEERANDRNDIVLEIK
jgi:hypothetical protein